MHVEKYWECAKSFTERKIKRYKFAFMKALSAHDRILSSQLFLYTFMKEELKPIILLP